MTLVIPTHYGSNKLAILLDSLVRLNNVSRLLQIIVVSNLPDSKVQNKCREYETRLNVSYKIAGSIGVNKARNVGLRLAKNDICFFVDDDCSFENENWFYEISNCFASFNVVAVGGFYFPLGEMTIAGMVYWLKITSWLLRYRNPGNEFSFRLVGGCLALKRSKLGSLSFDESIVFGGAETELITRLNRMGLSLMLKKNIWVRHDFRISLWQLVYKAYRQGQYHYQMSSSDHAVFPNQRRSFSDIEKVLMKKYLAKQLGTRLKFVLLIYIFVFKLSGLTNFRSNSVSKRFL